MPVARIIWALCLVLAAAFYLLTDSVLGLAALLVVVVVPVCAIVISQLFSRRLGAKLAAPATVEKNQELICALQATNSHLLPLAAILCRLSVKNAFTGEQLDSRMLFPLGSRDTATVPFSLESTHCGSLEISAPKLLAFDAFGLFSTTSKVEALAKTVVLPKTFMPHITVVPNLTKDVEADEYSQTKSGFDPSETFAVRDYEPGDSLKLIHWKLTSKYDSLIVKEPGLPVRHSFLVLLETCLPETMPHDADVADALGEILISICQALAESEIVFDIAWYDHELATVVRYNIPTMDEFSGILEKLLSAYSLPGSIDLLSRYTETFDSTEFEHVLYLSRHIPYGIDSFAGEGQLTAVICAQDVLGEVVDEAGNYHVFYCTPASYEIELSSLVI